MEKYEKLWQFWLFLQQLTKDTQDYLVHVTQEDKKAALQGQLEAVELITRKFQQVFTMLKEEPGLPFEESKEFGSLESRL